MARARRQPRPTLVVVTADHGEISAIMASRRTGSSRMKPRCGCRSSSPSSAGAGAALTARSIDRPVRHVDVLPTLLEALGVTMESDLPGSSMLALIGGSTVPDRASYFEALSANINRGWPPLRGAVANREKYIDLPVPELYDLVDDPRETHNSLQIGTDRRGVVRRALEQFKTTRPPRLLGPQTTPRRAPTRRRLCRPWETIPNNSSGSNNRSTARNNSTTRGGIPRRSSLPADSSVAARDRRRRAAPCVRVLEDRPARFSPSGRWRTR